MDDGTGQLEEAGGGLRRYKIQTNPNDPRHGSLNGYTNLHCRCERCVEARHTYDHRGIRRRYNPKEDVADSILSVKPYMKLINIDDDNTKRVHVDWGNIPFERSPFDIDAARRRAAGAF